MDRRQANAILVCNHYGCPIKAGYARRNPPLSRKTIVSTLLRGPFAPPILYLASRTRADTRVNWNMIKRRFRCPVIKSDSSISRSFLTIKVDLLVAILPPPPMRTRRLIKFQLRSLATIIHLYTHIYVLWFPRSLTFENSRFREKRWLSAG